MKMKIIKTIPFQLISLTLCLLFTWSSCSENKIIEQEYLEVSLSTYTFDATSPEELVIHVKANPTWSTNLEHAAWFSVAERGDDYLIIRAQDNTSIYPRVAYLELSSGIHTKYIYVSQLGKREPSDQFLTFPQFSSSAISSNGQYLAGVISQRTNIPGEIINFLFKIDLKSGDQVQLDKSSKAITVRQVADTGLITVDKNTVKGFYTSDGAWTELQVPAGSSSVFIAATSDDGETIVGSVSYPGSTKPAVWKNNEVSFLSAPALDIYDRPLREDVVAAGCSADGTVIYGHTANTKVLLYWRNGEVQYAGSDIFKLGEITIPGPMGEITIQHMDCLNSIDYYYGISPNGRYLVATLAEAQEDKHKALFPAVYDIEEQKTFVVRDLANADGARDARSVSVTDDMDISYSQLEVLNEFPYIAVPVYGYVYDSKLKKSITTAEYIKKETGLSLAAPTYMVQRKCSDGRTFYGVNSLEGVSGRVLLKWAIRPRI